MKQFTEEDIIAYQLGELPKLRAWQLKRALETDATLAAEAEEIAATLRAFRGDDINPVVDQAMLDRTWSTIRPSLAVLTPPQTSRTKIWAIACTGALAGALAVFALMSLTHRTAPTEHEIATAPTSAPTTVSQHTKMEAAEKVSEELHEVATSNAPRSVTHTAAFNRPGPLTMTPVDAVAEDPRLARHLDAAERVLTEVSHTDGPLPHETQKQVHRLLLQNALYRQSAERRGDMAVAGVIDDLGRILTVLDAEPQQTTSTTLSATTATPDDDAFRLSMNLGGVLLDLRILHHNARTAKE